MLGSTEYITREFTHFYLEYREYERDADEEPKEKLTSRSSEHCTNLYQFYCFVVSKLIVGKPKQIERAISAALANALIHANYYNKFGIIVEKRDQNITITNPGGMRVSLREQAQEKKSSDPRNSEVARLFASVGIGSGTGEGMGFIRRQEECTVEERFDPDMVVFTWQGKRIAASR